jgi:hypothetical protein
METLIKENKYKVTTSFNEELASYSIGYTFTLIEKKVINPYLSRNDFSRIIDLTNRISLFNNYQENWDSYNAKKITSKAIQCALETLSILSFSGLLNSSIDVNVFPMRDGGIQFDFDMIGNEKTSELEIAPDGKFRFLEYNSEGDIINEVENFSITNLKSCLTDSEYAC